MRFIAFMMVYLFHGGVPWPLLERLVGTTASQRLQENGGYGVQLFFILSGYLITTLLSARRPVTAASPCAHSGSGESCGSGRSIT